MLRVETGGRNNDYGTPEEEKNSPGCSPVRAIAVPKILTGWSPSRNANYYTVQRDQ
jgi:hypothetical protein